MEMIQDQQDYLIENPNLKGGWAPVFKELVDDKLQVIGKVPDDLNGLYVRNGPSPQFIPEGRYHWYDGDGMLHAVRFENGHVEYRNRWVLTEGLLADREAGAARLPGLKGRMPAGALPDNALKNTSNTDVKFHNGSLLSMWYRGGSVYQVDPSTLETLGKLEPDPRLIGLQISAHSRVDERTGEFMFFAYGNTAPYMHYGVIGSDGNLKTLIPIALPGPRLPHDMAITENYSVLHDFPLVNNPEALASGRYSLEFRQNQPSRFAIVPRNGNASEVRWFEGMPRYMLHVVNAWEEKNERGEVEVVMLGTPYSMPKKFDGSLDIDRLLFTIGTQGTDYELYQWRFNLTTGKTREGVLDDILNTEFPMINSAFQGRKNRYSYNVLMGRMRTLEQPQFAGLAKYDLLTGSAVTYHPGPGYWFSEAPFAAREGAVDEDDGYIVGFVWNSHENRSEVWIFDAKTITDGPVARVILPQRVPNGFHATWINGLNLKSKNK